MCGTWSQCVGCSYLNKIHKCFFSWNSVSTSFIFLKKSVDYWYIFISFYFIFCYLKVTRENPQIAYQLNNWTGQALVNLFVFYFILFFLWFDIFIFCSVEFSVLFCLVSECFNLTFAGWKEPGSYLFIVLSEHIITIIVFHWWFCAVVVVVVADGICSSIPLLVQLFDGEMVWLNIVLNIEKCVPSDWRKKSKL